VKSNDVRLIPIEAIRILNPRFRDKRRFEKIVQSIRNLGLKKPIRVSPRSEDGEGYDLVCGQGRIEAFVALGHKEIPALVVETSNEDRLLMSLVENMARRFPHPTDLIHEIERLKAEGHSHTAIGKKLDLYDSFISGLVSLNQAGEERLLDEAIRGRIPLGVAIEISKAENVEMQRELLKAYESKQLNHASIRSVRRLIEQRRFLGKKRGAKNRTKVPQTTADGMVNAYRKESQRQKLMVRKAGICEAKLIFLVTAFKRLFRDDNFVNLLRAEDLHSMPKCLSDKIDFELKEGA